MSKDTKLYYVSKSNGTPILSTLMFLLQGIKKFSMVSPGIISIKLTPEEVEKLRKHGCTVIEVSEEERNYNKIKFIAPSPSLQ